MDPASVATAANNGSPPKHAGGQPARKRGRPAMKQEDALQARRRQNREAQIAYRKRKQAAEAAHAQRVRRLEDIVEQLSSAFVGFVDEVLSYEAVQKCDGLMGSLQKTIEVVSTLAKEVVDPEEFAGLTSTTTNDIGPSSPSSDMDMDCKKQESPRVGQNPLPMFSAPWLSQRSDERDATTSSSQTAKSATATVSDSEKPDLFYSDVSQNPLPRIHTDVLPKLAPQIFGNGALHNPWDVGGLVKPPKHRRLKYLDSDSFAVRLLEGTLAHSYAVLLEVDLVPGSESHRIFRWALQFETREYALFHMRWLLGPGRKHYSLAIDFPARRCAHNLALGIMPPKDCLDLSDSDDVDDLSDDSEEEQAVYDSVMAPMLSVMGVQKKLEELGARFISPETIEITIRSQGLAGSPTVPNSDLGYMAGFMPFTHAPCATEVPLTMQLSASLLIRNLAATSVCLFRGPGFPAVDLVKAINASITSTRGGNMG